MLVNPSKHIRKAIIETLSPLPVWSNLVPKTATTPTAYALITSMGLQETARSKGCYEWEVSFNIDVFYRGVLGQDYSAAIDDIVEDIIPKMKSLTSPVVQIKNVYLEFQNDLSFNTSTNSINRKVLNYTVWCNYQEETT